MYLLVSVLFRFYIVVTARHALSRANMLLSMFKTYVTVNTLLGFIGLNANKLYQYLLQYKVVCIIEPE